MVALSSWRQCLPLMLSKSFLVLMWVFDAQVLRASISVLLRDEPWKVRLSNSAGVKAQKLAAYFSKRYNILRYTWPPEARAQQGLSLQSVLSMQATYVKTCPKRSVPVPFSRRLSFADRRAFLAWLTHYLSFTCSLLKQSPKSFVPVIVTECLE